MKATHLLAALVPMMALGCGGSDGATGATGPAGAQGQPGAPGAAGAKGDQGDPGQQGAQGPRGDAGPQGPQGDAGPQGPRGDAGPQGPQGDAGPQGPQGDAGSSSTSLVSAVCAVQAGGTWTCSVVCPGAGAVALASAGSDMTNATGFVAASSNARESNAISTWDFQFNSEGGGGTITNSVICFTP